MGRNEKEPRIKDDEEHNSERRKIFRDEEIRLGESGLSQGFSAVLISSRWIIDVFFWPAVEVQASAIWGVPPTRVEGFRRPQNPARNGERIAARRLVLLLFLSLEGLQWPLHQNSVSRIPSPVQGLH